MEGPTNASENSWTLSTRRGNVSGRRSSTPVGWSRGVCGVPHLPVGGDGGVVEDLGRVRERLGQVMAGGPEALPGGEAFNDLALEVFRIQCRANPIYGALVRGRGLDPGAITDWREIPPVPAAAFKEVRLVTGSADHIPLLFRTSGTTRGGERRGEHAVVDPSLYRAALLPPFRDHLLPDGARLPFGALLPSPRVAPDSSLSFMVDAAMSEFAAPGGGWFLDRSGVVDQDTLLTFLQGGARSGTPLLLVGTAFAWVHWMDLMDADGLRIDLPEGSRILETGGFKGRSRVVPRGELYRGLEERLGVPRGRIVNEYGMTELLSQFYEPVLSGGTPVEPEERHHVGPPWVRTRVLDPETLADVDEGREGLLCHLDLANLHSVAAVLTEDLGAKVGEGFRVLGRVAGAEPRGCSLLMEELLGGPGRSA